MDTTRHPNGGNGPPPAALVHATTANAARTRRTAGLALFVLCGVGRWMLPAPRNEDYDGGDDPPWASRGDAAGGWGTKHHHPIVVGDRGGGGSPGGGSDAGDGRTNDAGDGSSPPDDDDASSDDSGSALLAARTSDLLAALAPLVSLPSRLPHRPEYEPYRSGADGTRTEEDVAADVLRDVRTAHGRAFDFLLHRDVRLVGIDDPSLVQRFVLALLFYATGGKDSEEDDYEEDDGAMGGGSVGASAGWNVGTAHFLSESHECRWNEKKDVDDGFWGMLSFGNEGRRVGVTKCNADMEVTAIRLADLHLVGFVPEEIKWLSSLESLDVQNNHLAGPIPEAIGELDALTYLSLDGNNFSGTIPDVFDDLRHLERAYLNFNEFGGAMPRSLCALREEGGGALTDLWSDCGGYPISCTCCTVCCDATSECYEMESQREEGGGGEDG